MAMLNVLRLAGHAPPIELFLDSIWPPVHSAIHVATNIHCDLESTEMQLFEGDSNSPLIQWP
jgi:hypothetical protein